MLCAWIASGCVDNVDQFVGDGFTAGIDLIETSADAGFLANSIEDKFTKGWSCNNVGEYPHHIPQQEVQFIGAMVQATRTVNQNSTRTNFRVMGYQHQTE